MYIDQAGIHYVTYCCVRTLLYVKSMNGYSDDLNI
jgi:hypothetical protein